MIAPAASALRESDHPLTPGAARDDGRAGGRADLRMPLLGVAAWVGALLAAVPLLPAVLAGTAGLLLVLLVGWRSRRRGSPGAAVATLAVVVVAAAVLASALVRDRAVDRSPVAALAQEAAVVTLSGTVVSDPRILAGPFGEQVVVRLRTEEVIGRGLRHRVAVPVVVLGDPAWAGVPLGTRVETLGRLRPDDGGGAAVAGLLTGAAPPTTTGEPGVWWRMAAAVRASIRDAVAHRPPDQRALVPSLVVGDDAELAADLEADFQITGLTHLTAVSGTNLTLLVGFLLVVARWCRVRGRWLVAVAALGIVGFVLVARTEPSVLRAAAMGTVGLLALGSNGRQRALRGLGVATLALLLIEPSLAVTAGFALSVLATAGIVVLAPGWRDAMARWMPRWSAEAIAVPAAAQLACTPIVAAISGQVSLVAVLANLLVAPAVGPATVLGLAAGLLGLLPGFVGSTIGAALGTGAGWCVGWIALVARTGADLPAAALTWGTGPVALALLTALCLALAALAPWLLRSARVALAATVLVVVAVLLGRGGLPALPGLPGLPGSSGPWPAPGWVAAMCDVGQGDALVLRAGPGSAVVVDVGPDPAAIDGCLDRLGVEQVPVVVLTHFHADHVDGLAGVLDGRQVGAVWTSNVLDPPGAVEAVVAVGAESSLVPTLAPTSPVRYGEVTMQPVWPRPGPPRTGPGDGTGANDASVVLLAEVGGVRLLLTGDLEPPGQAALAAALPGLDVDVLKVPHHGSRYQSLPWLVSLRPEAALVSVGADNDYGHPAPEVVEALRATGAEVARTDELGDVLVVADASGGVRLLGRG